MALFMVNSNADSGSGTLRQAISDASGGDTIEFAADISNITLTSGELIIDKSLIVNGPGSNKLTISGNNWSRVFSVSSGIDVTINGILFTNGSSERGGAISNQGTLTITNSTLSRNTATDWGGAIYNAGTLTITNSILSNNDCIIGGAIYNAGTITIKNSTFSNISSSSICNVLGTITIKNSTFSNNTFPVGGAIDNNGGTLEITDSTFSDNTASFYGGAIRSYGTLTITNSTFLNNTSGDGGAIYNGYGTCTITNSTFSGNTATNYGGAIFNNDNGSFTILNSTLSGNTADRGGAIYNTGTLQINFSTIAENQSANGAGVYSTSEPVTFKNSIMGNNDGQNYGGTVPISALGVNFDTDGTCPGFTQVTSAMLNLGPLALNAPGTTETHALLSGSAAIDSVTLCTDIAGNVVTTDQRGVSRPQGIACDAGAYEAKAPCRGVLFIDT